MTEYAQKLINSSDIYKYLVEYRGDLIGQVKKIPNIYASIINRKYAVISAVGDIINDVKDRIPAILFISYISVFVLEGTSANNVSNIRPIKENPYLNLTGSGVLVGIVDTGIDYMNREFIREDDTTRIEAIWDQSLNHFNWQNMSEPIEYNRVASGKVFFEDQINAAIKLARQGGDPYSIVPSKDEVGHGTNIASIVGARGYDENFKGIANDCSYVIIKLKESEFFKKVLAQNQITGISVYDYSTIVEGFEYLKSYALYRNKPMIIVNAVGATDYSHDGSDLFSRYVDEIASIRGLVFISGCGNEGAAAGHAAGFMNNAGEVVTRELNIPRDMNELYFRIWVRKPNKMALSIISPSGQDTNFIQPKDSRTDFKFIYENTQLNVRNEVSDSITGNQVITIYFKNIKKGIWKFNLKGVYIVDGRFDIWLPPHKILPPDTVFTEPYPDQTLTASGGTKNVISVAYYNQITNAVMAESGRGFPLYRIIKPNIAAPGVDINAVGPNDTKVSVSGSTAAASIVAGACALLVQWGIVDGNDREMYSAKIISYLTAGADRSDNIKYPDKSLGYGKFDFTGVFNNIAGIYSRHDKFKEYSRGKLFFRIPEEMVVKNFVFKI